MEAKPKKLKRRQALAKLVKQTFHSLVYSSPFGRSLYFDRETFEGEIPGTICITIDWKPNKEQSDAKTYQRTEESFTRGD